MRKIVLFLLFAAFTQIVAAQTPDSQLYELRTYHCNNGKRSDLIARFQNHTRRIFEKHGMENIGYWIPSANENDLIYILSFPNKTARNAAWKAFIEDEEWKEVARKSNENGEIIKSIDSQFIILNPELTTKIETDSGMPTALFELRTYHCFLDKFPNIVARFRDYTRAIFETHGMKNIAYWQTVEADGAQPKLVYIIAHQNAEAAKASWDNFRNDPKWKKVAEESQVNGKIVERVESVFMTALPFSGIK